MSSEIIFNLISSDTFILKCTSTGGPATTVTWTRDSVTVTEGNLTVVTDTEAPYTSTHRLRVTERLEGLYTCSVYNPVSNITFAALHVVGKLNLHCNTFIVFLPTSSLCSI